MPPPARGKLEQAVSVFYQVTMSHNDGNGLIFEYALLHHLSAL